MRHSSPPPYPMSTSNQPSISKPYNIRRHELLGRPHVGICQDPPPVSNPYCSTQHSSLVFQLNLLTKPHLIHLPALRLPRRLQQLTNRSCRQARTFNEFFEASKPNFLFIFLTKGRLCALKRSTKPPPDGRNQSWQETTCERSN